MARILTSEFTNIAAQWRSYKTHGDPGGCLDQFGDNGLVRDEAHRKTCIDYIEAHCRKVTETNPTQVGDGNPEGQHEQLDAMVEYLKSCPVSRDYHGLNLFEVAYVKAALFSTNDQSDGSGGTALNANYGPEHLSSDAVARVKQDCARFCDFYGDLLTETNCNYWISTVTEYAGISFWMTRCGHDGGFRKGDWKEPVATVLTEAAKSFGETDLVIGDDGRLHIEGGTRDPEMVAASPVPRL